MIKRHIALSLVTALALCVGQLDAGETDLITFLGGQGCVIGPSTEAAAIEAGFASDDIVALKERGVAEGVWHVLPREICTIRLPDVQSEIGFEDVAPFVSDPEEHIEWGDYGCFLDADELQESLMMRGWSEDRAFAAYLSFVAQGLVSGDWHFYTTSPLRTPVGFQYTGSGDCGLGLTVGKMRANHAVLVETFGDFIRQSAPVIPCERGQTLMHLDWPEVMERLSGEQNTNAWIPFEMSMIAMGAGWYDGLSYRERGKPRPPICHYP